MRRARSLAIAVTVVLTGARSGSAQQAAEATGKNFHKIIALDSVQLEGLVTSPDGRWLVFGTRCSATVCSNPWGGEDGLWIMPSDGHAKPTRLLTTGHNDRQPNWFPSGDRLAFASDRMSRDGSHKTYAMSVAIDPKSGAVVGQPRQISTEETSWMGQVSPDSKWVPYWVQGESAIKVIPTNGGAARTLVKMPGVSPPFMWSRDGKTFYFHFGARGAKSVGWYKVSADGGTPTRAYDNVAAMPYAPNTDMHVVEVRSGEGKNAGVRRVELYDAKNRLVGAADHLTQDMDFYFPRGTSGGMYVQESNRRYVNYLVSLDDGTTRPLIASRFAWVDGWLDNSTVTIDGADSTGRGIVGTVDLAGHESHFLLPADAGGCCGWVGVVGSSISFARGQAQYIADARTGATKQLTTSIVNGLSTYGRGGFYSDGDRFIIPVPNGDRSEIRAYTADGQSTLLRSLAKSDSVVAAAVHGDLVAWATKKKDSITVFSARGPNGRPRKLVTVRSTPPHRFFEIAWSFDATMLAITGLTVQPALSVIHVDESGAPRGAPVVLNPRATEPWTLRWTPDNRSVVVTAIPLGAKDEVLMRVPIDPKEAPTFYARNDEWAFVSPDGKHAAYPSVRTLGTTIWWVDFQTADGVKLSGKP